MGGEMYLERDSLHEGPHGLRGIDFYNRSAIDPDTLHVTVHPFVETDERLFITVCRADGAPIADAYAYARAELEEAKQWLLDMTRVKLI